MLEKVKMIDIEDSMLTNLSSADFEGLLKVGMEYADVVLKRSEPYSEKLNDMFSSLATAENKRVEEINHENEDWVEDYMSIYKDLAS
jgi:starch synthase